MVTIPSKTIYDFTAQWPLEKDDDVQIHPLFSFFKIKCTFTDILLEFNEQLVGVAHGMGKRSRLPDYQLNVAESKTETEDLPEQVCSATKHVRKSTTVSTFQATELVRRLNSLMTKNELGRKWALVTIATGTEEVVPALRNIHSRLVEDYNLGRQVKVGDIPRMWHSSITLPGCS